MRITRIETIPVQVPIRPELVIRGSLGVHAKSPFVLLKIHTDEGITGLDEESFTPALTGENPGDIERLTAKMRRVVFGHPFTKSGIEIALWDILGKVAGLPIYRLLGGAVRDTVPVKMSVSGAESACAAEIADWALAQGLKTLKVKAVRVAIDIIRKLAATCDIYFAEQPVAALDTQWMVDEWLGTECPHGTHLCPIADDVNHWSDTVKIPYRPMPGCIGTAPDWDVPTTHPAGLHGGNMDIVEVAPGSTLYLPVYVQGALLDLGSAHAAMGHGEISALGLEMSAETEITVDIRKGWTIPGPASNRKPNSSASPMPPVRTRHRPSLRLAHPLDGSRLRLGPLESV